MTNRIPRYYQCEPGKEILAEGFNHIRLGRGQENWTYAIDINQVIERLDVEIVKRM